MAIQITQRLDGDVFAQVARRMAATGREALSAYFTRSPMSGTFSNGMGYQAAPTHPESSQERTRRISENGPWAE